MATSNSPPIVADNEKQADTTESTHQILGKPSRISLPPPISLDAPSYNNNGRLSISSGPEALPRISDLSTPTSAHQNHFETDVEAMITQTTTGETSKYKSANGRQSMGHRGLGDSQVWPDQSHWKQKAKEQKMKRSSSCLSRLSKRNRLIIKVLVVLFIVGAAVGIGLGISKPLGAAIWGQHQS